MSQTATERTLEEGEHLPVTGKFHGRASLRSGNDTSAAGRNIHPCHASAACCTKDLSLIQALSGQKAGRGFYIHRVKAGFPVRAAQHNSIHSSIADGFYEFGRGLCDGFQSFHHRFRVFVKMFDRRIHCLPILCLGKRIEYGLNEGRFQGLDPAELKTETGQLSRKMWRGWVEHGQLFPVTRLLDHAFGIAPRSFQVSHPLIFHAPAFDCKGRGWRDFDDVEVIRVLEVQCGSRKDFGILIVDGEVSPECNRCAVWFFSLEAGLNSFTMSGHGYSLLSKRCR